MKFLKRLWSVDENVKATYVFAIASFATSGINYIVTPIFTRLLSQAEYGVVSVYNSWYSIVRVFASLTLVFPGILNVGLHDYKSDRWKYLSTMLGITTGTTLFLGVLSLVFWRPICDFTNLSPKLIVIMLITCLTAPATTFWTYKNRYEYRYQTTFFVTVGSAVLAQTVSVAAVVLAARYQADLASIRIWSAGLVNATVAAALFVYICCKGKTFVDLPVWKKTALVALPLIPHYIGSTILSNTDKIMISNMVGNDKTAIYSLAAVLSAVGVLLWQAMSVTFAPFLNTKLAERKFREIRVAVKPLLSLVGIFCVIAALAAPEIIRILATKDYLEGIYVIPPVAAGIFIHAQYDTFAGVSFFHKRSVGIMIATLTAAASNIIMNAIAIPLFGYLAAGYTTLISNFILTSMHYIISRRVEPEKVYDAKFSILSVLIVTGCCLFCNLLYGFILIRYAFILALAAVIIIKRDLFISTLASMKVDG